MLGDVARYVSSHMHLAALRRRGLVEEVGEDEDSASESSRDDGVGEMAAMGGVVGADMGGFVVREQFF
jgi:hypothetical protein